MHPLTTSELQQRWQSTTGDQLLGDYEGRAELDRCGEIVLTPPPSFVHQRIANELARQIENQLGGSSAAGENASSRFGLRLTLPPNTYPL